MGTVGVIRKNDLPTFPPATLAAIAMAVSREIDGGAADMRPLLEEVMDALRRKVS